MSQRKMIAARTAVGVLGVLAALPALANHEPPGEVEPSADEQLCIYEVNRARSNPPAYGEKIGLDLAAVEARPPLAVNLVLNGSARFHADVMLDHHEFGHTSDVLGIGPNQMAADNGYDLFGGGLPQSWGTANSIESIFRSVNQIKTTPAAVKTLIIDKDVPGVGHRVHLLAINAFENHREIGAGWAAGSDAFPEFGLPQTLPTKLLSIQTGYRDVSQSFLTGVVFEDGNGNLGYDKGEGIGGATISVDGGPSTTSLKNGGWALPVGDGTYTVRCSGGGFAGESVALVQVAGQNVEIDFHSGQGAGEIGFAWQQGGIPAGPDVAIDATADIGVAPIDITFTGRGLTGGMYAWDLGNGSSADGEMVMGSYGTPGLYPVLLSGTDSTGSGAALRLVVAGGAEGAGPGTTPPLDESVQLKKALVKRKLKAPGKDQAKLVGSIELPAGLTSAEGLVVQVSIAGATRTFTLDAKGKAKLEDKSKIALKIKLPKDGSPLPAGVVAKVSALIKGDLAAPLEGAGLRNRTEQRVVDDVPVAVLLGGQPYVFRGAMMAKAKAGKSAKGTIAGP